MVAILLDLYGQVLLIRQKMEETVIGLPGQMYCYSVL